MTTIYVVTQGEYSDYGIERLFSTKALAEDFINGDPACHLEEYELDGPVPKIHREYWNRRVALTNNAGPSWYDMAHATSGQLLPESHGKYHFCEAERGKRAEPADFQYHEAHPGSRLAWEHADYGWICVTSYVSQEHADKLAVEAYQAWLRAGKPTSNWKPDAQEPFGTS